MSEETGTQPGSSDGRELRRVEGSTDLQRDARAFDQIVEIHDAWDRQDIPNIQEREVNEEIRAAAAANDPAHNMEVLTYEHGDRAF